MKLLTEEIEKSLPPLGTTEGEKDPLVRLKLFDSCGDWTWYVIEGSRIGHDKSITLDDKEYLNDMFFYGLVDGFEKELGEFSLTELELIKTDWGTPRIWRDVNFEPVRLSEVRKL